MRSRNLEVEDLDFFKELEKLIDEIWEEVMTWPAFARDTVGKQLVESADSSGSNLVEGDGRYSHKEAIRFFYIARGSAREARFWIKRARNRKLISKEKADYFTNRFNDIIPKINSIISTRRKWLRQINEEPGFYLVPHGETIDEHPE